MGLQQVLRRGMAGAALVALAAACSHSGEPVQEPGPPASGQAALPPAVRAEVALPALLGLSVDGLARRLGPARPVPAPVQAVLAQLPPGDPADSTRFFRCRSLDILVSYNAGTRRFSDVLLLGSNEQQLMQRAGLSAEARNYLLLSAFDMHRPTQMLGLRVIPLQPAPLQ